VHLYAGRNIGINGEELIPNSSNQGYYFFISGHIYGQKNGSSYPSSTLLASLPFLNKSSASFMMLSGDMYENLSDIDIRNLKKSFLSQVSFPIFNAPGNHDFGMHNNFNLELAKEKYKQHFGPAYSSFIFSNDLFLILDSESDNGAIKGEQLTYALKALDHAIEEEKVKNIFIFFHRLLFENNNPDFSDSVLSTTISNGGPSSNDDSFTQFIISKLKKNNHIQSYLIAGNVGYATTFFYEKHGNITYIANGLGDSSKDLLLKVTVPANKQASFELIPMAMSKENLLKLTDYDRNQLNHYDSPKRSSFKQFVLKLPFMKFLISLPPKHFFYLGILFGGLLFFLIFFLVRYISKYYL
jgi:hypothetical protein